jgi:hypothetical protein
MGIDPLSMKFLLYARKFGDFKNTITIGRHNFWEISVRDLKNLPQTECQKRHLRRNEYYVEELLKDCFGSSIVDSIDISEFEGATIIHDMNIEIPDELIGKYDTVIDGGTIEHIYNIPQALDNVSYLCKPGGQIIHMLPANNQCGHGFWQMSPELFFSLYSEKNGYKSTDVFLARPSNQKYFYKVIRPEIGKRVNIYSHDEVLLYIRSVRKEMEFSHKDVQQSDYVYLWNKQGRKETGIHYRLESFLRHKDLLFKMAKKIYLPYYRSVNGLSKHNSNLLEVNISNLLSR